MKRVVWVAGASVILVVLYLWVFGLKSRENFSGQITRLQYFESPPLVAVHFGNPSEVFVIQGIDGENQEDFAEWLDPSKVTIESIQVDADSIDNRWSDRLERKDVLQFGVHGKALGDTKPNWDDLTVAMGIARKPFPHGSFTVLNESEFSRLKTGRPITDVKVWGRLRYGNHSRFSFRKEPPSSIP